MFKKNIREIHFELSKVYENIEIKENDSNENLIEISVREGNREILAFTEKKKIEGESFEWGYFSNPIEKDFLVERNSTIKGFVSDIKDIFEKNRFDGEYLKNIEENE